MTPIGTLPTHSPVIIVNDDRENRLFGSTERKLERIADLLLSDRCYVAAAPSNPIFGAFG